jgi:hypothetical protein
MFILMDGTIGFHDYGTDILNLPSNCDIEFHDYGNIHPSDS